MTDVVVVGSGAAGLMAAASAADGGASVTLLERSSLFGGTSQHSGGGIWIPNNPLQAQAGIQDSPEDAETYLKRLTLGLVSEELIQAFVRGAPEAFDFLTKKTAVEWYLDLERPDYMSGLPGAGTGRTLGAGLYDTSRLGASLALARHPVWPGETPQVKFDEMRDFQNSGVRWSWVPLARDRVAKGIAVRGYALTTGLLEVCIKKGVKLVPNARATALTQKKGRVNGVVALRGGKSERYEAGGGVVLACGGFEWNRSMWDELIGVPLDGVTSPPYNEGDGLRMAVQVGAKLGALNHAYFVATVGGDPVAYEGKLAVRQDAIRPHTGGAIAVNRRGRRFADETMAPQRWVRPMIQFDPDTWEFPNLPAFQIFDRENREKYPLYSEDWTFDADGDAKPDWLAEAPSLRQLAEKIGIDPSGLEQQVKEFNAHAERGEDPVFHRGDTSFVGRKGGDRDFLGHRTETIRPLGPGPYYAYRLKVATWGTKGGPVINGNAQVIDYENRPIPGLYAAGSAAAALTGASYPGGGGSLGPAVTFGYLAARSLTSD